MITRVSTVIPEMKMSFHRCVLCEAHVTAELDGCIFFFVSSMTLFRDIN